MATIDDVRKLAGVSKTTVSRVINHSPDVKPVTRDKVLSAIKTLNYKPNALAQAFASNISNSIGLALPHFDSNYFGTILKISAQKAQQENKKLFVMDTHNHVDGEIEAVRTLSNQRCDIIILYSRHLSEAKLIELQSQIEPKIIVLDRSLLTNALFSFDFDQEQLGHQAINHLVELGHTQIACITTQLENETGKKRLSAYKNKLKQQQIPVNPKLIIEGNSSIESGYNAVFRLIESKEKFTAIYACNDLMAYGAMRALYEHNLTIPTDISITGIDDDWTSAYNTPSLTSVSVPIESLITDVLDLAFRLIKSSNETPKHYGYTGKLIVRESTA